MRAVDLGGFLISGPGHIAVSARRFRFWRVFLESGVVLGNDAEFGGLLDAKRKRLLEQRIVFVALRPLMIVLFCHVLLHVIAERKFLRSVRFAAHFALVSA